MATVMSSGRSLYKVTLKDEDDPSAFFVFIASSKEILITNVKASLANNEDPDAVNWVDWDNIKVLDNANVNDVIDVMFSSVTGCTFDADKFMPTLSITYKH